MQALQREAESWDMALKIWNWAEVGYKETKDYVFKVMNNYWALGDRGFAPFGAFL